MRFCKKIGLGGFIGILLSVGWSLGAWAQEPERLATDPSEPEEKHDPKVQKPLEVKPLPRIPKKNFGPSYFPPLENYPKFQGSAQRGKLFLPDPEVTRRARSHPERFRPEGFDHSGASGVGIDPPHFPDPAVDPRFNSPAVPDFLDHTPSAPTGGPGPAPITSPPSEPVGSDSTNR